MPDSVTDLVEWNCSITITSMSELPQNLRRVSLSDGRLLTSMEGCPPSVFDLSIQRCESLKTLEGLEGPPIKRLAVTNAGVLTSFVGVSEVLETPRQS